MAAAAAAAVVWFEYSFLGGEGVGGGVVGACMLAAGSFHEAHVDLKLQTLLLPPFRCAIACPSVVSSSNTFSSTPLISHLRSAVLE